jgi:hypothetical protein
VPVRFSIDSVSVGHVAYRNGDPFWDGDQTLYEIVARDDERERQLKVVVLRGDEFISRDQLKHYLERSFRCVRDLEVLARPPANGGPPEVVLEILPNDVLPAAA